MYIPPAGWTSPAAEKSQVKQSGSQKRSGEGKWGRHRIKKERVRHGEGEIDWNAFSAWETTQLAMQKECQLFNHIKHFVFRENSAKRSNEITGNHATAIRERYIDSQISQKTPVKLKKKSIRRDSPSLRSQPSLSGLKKVCVRSFPSSSGILKGSFLMLSYRF